ncbi:MAG: orotate phosphoribosyltransferase [Bacteroidales bacterium]
MRFNEEIAQRISEYLLQVRAIKLSPKEPFTWASGIQSPIYCDNRITLSYPKVRNFIRHSFSQAINDVFGEVDVVVGVATGGIAQGALVAQELGLPFAYVRSSAKAHGLTNMIEGVVDSGQSVVVIEDLVSTGGSSLNAVKALRERGAIVKGMLAIFTYNLPVAEENFTREKCKLVTLSDYNTLIQQATEKEYVAKEDVETLLKWKENPSEWKKV